jgi:hypothetical protein
MRRCQSCSALLILSIAWSAFSAEDVEVPGRVVDQQGVPVADASVASFWRANGPGAHLDGTKFDLSNPAEVARFWSKVGQMEPAAQPPLQTANDGKFQLKCRSDSRCVMAMDRSRAHGGIVELPDPYRGEVIEIHLQSLFTVRGTMKSALPGKTAQWSHLYVELAPNPSRPLALDRVISCGSFDGTFEFRLPAGEYILDAYGISDSDGLDEIDLQVNPAPKLSLKGSGREINLGVLELREAEHNIHRLKREARAQGTWRDYKKHYGEPPPDWHVTDAQGIRKDIRDFRGKWLLIDFWGLGCAPCLAKGLPKLMSFYEKHQASREKFEIIGVCIDYAGEIQSIRDLHAALKPIETHVWKGKTIPFPIVLDSTFQTWERFGLDGLGTVILIDPEGKLVEGDESTLELILSK